MRASTVIIAILVTVFALCLIFSFIVFFILCRRGKTPDGMSITRYYPEDQAAGYRLRIRQALDYFESREAEHVHITSEDGIDLAGVYLKADNPSGRAVLFCHGFHGSGKTDFSLFCRWFLQHGFDALVIDQRAHGNSGGHFLTFGERESHDCLGWARYLAQRLGDEGRIVVFGISMGAASVMRAMVLDLPSQVKAVIADCGYTATGDEYPFAMRLFKIPMVPIGLLGAIWCSLLAHFNALSHHGAIDAVAQSDLPLMLVHGGDDPFIPTEMVYRLKEASLNCQAFLVVDGAAHAGSWLLDEAAYEETLEAFLAKTMP